MKGAYLAKLDLSEPHLLGVAKKIDGQVASFKKYGIELDVYSLSKSGILKNQYEFKQVSNTRISRRYLYYVNFYRHLARELAVLDIIYIRYQRSTPMFIWMLAVLKRKKPGLVTLLEIPSYPYGEEDRSVRGKVLYFIDSICRRFLKPYINRIVTFSPERKIFGVDTICTDNGSDVEGLKLYQTGTRKTATRLVGVANLAYWHGYDRVIAGLADYYSGGNVTDEVVFDIVGCGAELEPLKNKVAEYGLQDCVFFHGPLFGEGLEAVIKHAHIGVGVLGMHRRNILTSDLKSREYCARGLPFLTAYRDPDFPESFKYQLAVAADDSAVDMKGLLAWYRDFDEEKDKLLMRAYAFDNLTWKSKLAPITEYVQSVVYS